MAPGTSAPLLIDRASAAVRADESAVRDWGREQRVFVSSLIDGYGEYRQAAIDAITGIDAQPVAFERFGGRDSDPHEAYISEVRSSTQYVGLLGARYGRPLPDRFSATHAEFREAEADGVRTSVWVQEDVDREGPQQSFVDEVRAFQVTGSFRSPDELEQRLAERLRVIASEELAPWVKLGDVVFRAVEITETSDVAHVHAHVRDPTVVDALRALTDRGRRSRLPFAYGNRVLIAEPLGVSTTTRAGRSVSIELELRTMQTNAPTRISFNGSSWDELTELAVRVSVLGEANPLGIMSHMVELPNPFSALQAARRPEEALRPIARLLLSELLVIERGVARITDFALGQPAHGGRRLRLGWQNPSPYYGQSAPPPNLIEGTIAWT